MFSNCLVLVADGNEEMETVIPVDVLRRAEVTLACMHPFYIATCFFRSLSLWLELIQIKLSSALETSNLFLMLL